MLNTGDWVEFHLNGKTHKGFVITPNIFATTIETLGKDYQIGQPYKKMAYHVPNYQITLLSDDILPQDRTMLIDMALASHNQGLFESLVGSVGVIN